MNLYLMLLAIFYVETININSFYGKRTTLERNIQISHFLFHLQVKRDGILERLFFHGMVSCSWKAKSTIWAPSWFRAKQEKENFANLAKSVNCKKLKLIFFKKSLWCNAKAGRFNNKRNCRKKSWKTWWNETTPKIVFTFAFQSAAWKSKRRI